MKWVTFVSCLFLVCFVKSKPLSRKKREGGLEGTTSRFATSPLEEFDSLALAWFSQSVQQATYEEVEKLVNSVAALAKNCSMDGLPDPKCANSLHTNFLNEICHRQEFASKYSLTDCCAKVDPERDDCFLSHKNATPEFIPPFQKPDGEDVCRAPRNAIIAMGIYETARRYPDTSIPTILVATDAYQKVLATCCQEADKNPCFYEKAGAVTQRFNEANFLQQYTCLILTKNGRKAVRDFKLAQLSQKFPKAEYTAVDTLAELITLANEECCRGASFQCFRKKVDVSNYACNHKDTLSTKVEDCCPSPQFERECLLTLENDDKPAGLSPTARDFIESQDVCQRYAENKTTHLDKFLYEYSRRHPEFSIQLLLRIGEMYKTLLEQCCKTTNPTVCLAQLDEQVNKHIAENLEAIKPYCASAKQGDYIFQNLQLFVYTKRAPQLSFDDLYKYTKQLAALGAKCCPLNDTQQLKCVDQSVDLVLGAICLQDQILPINQQVHQCCSTYFPRRRQCFLGLGKDENYTPVPVSHKWSSEDVCSADSGELQLKKQRFLVNLIRHRPDITEDQARGSLTHFSDMREKCCQDKNSKECFEKED